MIVFPVCLGWETHEDRFGSSIRFQSELCAAVPHQVEFDIAPASEILPLLVAVCERDRVILFHEVPVKGRERLADTLDERKPRLLCQAAFAFQVIEKYSADSARFIAVTDEEIVVSPFFEVGVVGGMMLVADLLQVIVKIFRVCFVNVMRREVDATAEPPDILLVLQRMRDLEVTDVHVD